MIYLDLKVDDLFICWNHYEMRCSCYEGEVSGTSELLWV